MPRAKQQRHQGMWNPRRPDGLINLYRVGQYVQVYPAVEDLDSYLYTVAHTTLEGSAQE